MTMSAGVSSPLQGKSVLEDQPGWDEARRAWQLHVDQRPAAVVYPESAQDVVDAVRVRARARAACRRPGDGPQRRAAGLAARHAAAQDRPDAGRDDRRAGADRPRRCGRPLAGGRAGRCRARTGDRGRHLAGRRRRRLHDRRRHRPAQPPLRPGGEQRPRGRARHRRRRGSSGRTASASPICSGRCAAVAAASAS